MKKFNTTIYITKPTGEETSAPQIWSGEDIDDAAEKARSVYEEWFTLSGFEGCTYRLGEFVEAEEDEKNG